ncbi:MAG: hypothetical protein AB1714_07590 [Acidobacteriota bacterium]
MVNQPMAHESPGRIAHLKILLSQRRVKILGLLIGAVVVLGTIDRMSLMIWRWRVAHQYVIYKEACEATQGPDPEYGIVGWSPPSSEFPVRLIWVRSIGPHPYGIVVDGGGGLTLFYTPPYLAWSRYLPYLTDRSTYGQPGVYPYDDVYLISLELRDDRGKDLQRPQVSLEHGLP